ncbi:MAG: TraX family protein, partial [Angelakisella sp.]
MTSFTLKIIAIAAMLIDHIGYMFFPDMIIFRLIGRIAFPIFAFFVAEGIRFTHDRKKYLTRLLLLAVISEIPFDLMRNGSAFSPSSQNVCFTLAVGVVCVWLLEKKSLTNLY